MIRSRIPAMGVFLFLLSSGCMLPTDVVVSKLQHVMDTVDLESAAWREQVDKTSQELVNCYREAIAEDLDQVVQRGIGASGVEFRCDVDFIRNRVKQELQAIIDTLPYLSPAKMTMSMAPLFLDRPPFRGPMVMYRYV